MDWKKLYDDVDQWAAAHRQEFIDDISEVCRIRSVSIMNKQDPENAGQSIGDVRPVRF